MGIRLRRPLLLGGGGKLTYTDRILSVEPANQIAYWPLDELAGAVADNAEGTAARDGTYTGVTLGQSVLPFTCPYFDGVNDYIEIYTSSLASAFDATLGTLFGWYKVATGAWTDGADRRFCELRADGDNRISVAKTAVNNQVTFVISAGGTLEIIVKNDASDTGLFSIAATWNAAGNWTAYYNGVQEGTPVSIDGTWVGSLANNAVCIGVLNTTPTFPWNGYAAHFAIWTKVLTPAQILNLHNWGL